MKDALPKERLGKAVGYPFHHAEALQMCLAHANCDLDNSIVERAIRPVAIGCKKKLFAETTAPSAWRAC